MAYGKTQLKQSTIEEFWSYQRKGVELNQDEFTKFVKNKVRFATIGQLEGAWLCLNYEITNFLTPREQAHYLSTVIMPIIQDAIDNPVELQQSLF